MFEWLTSEGRQNRKTAERLYRNVVAQAREPVFYADFQVEDTPDGRLEMVMMYASLLINRLCQPDAGRAGKKLAQSVFDVMFRNIDLTIREMGVGDLAVPKRMKKMMTGFKGRAYAYDEAIRQQDVGALVHVLIRNLYAENKNIPNEADLQRLAKFIQASAAQLQLRPLDYFHGAGFSFMSVEELIDKNDGEMCAA